MVYISSVTQGGYLGSSFPTPTDPNYYLGSTGLSSLVPQAFNANTLAAMFAPQGMQYTPANSMASNPFLQQFLQASSQALKGQRPQTGGEDPTQMTQKPYGLGTLTPQQ